MIRCHYSCRQCGEEIEVAVTINEEDDLPENCPECNAPIPDKAHQDVQESAIDRAADSADLWRDDR